MCKWADNHQSQYLELKKSINDFKEEMYCQLDIVKEDIKSQIDIIDIVKEELNISMAEIKSDIYNKIEIL